MDEPSELDFLSALGEEFSAVLCPVVGTDVDPHDAYEVFAEVLGKDFGPACLLLLSDALVAGLRVAAARWLESDAVTDDHVRAITRRALSRWPGGE
jgi:hypothetical protein